MTTAWKSVLVLAVRLPGCDDVWLDVRPGREPSFFRRQSWLNFHRFRRSSPLKQQSPASRARPAEPDEEVQQLIKASAGPNLGMDFLPGALGYDAFVHHVDAQLASTVLAFDAFVENVDRSWRNPNLLIWHGGLWLIDHGATLYFHHN